MNRSEFMKELEYLLQDIPQEDKEDALAYYQDYLEEAGEAHEAEALREFGSPERVAAMIRAELDGSLNEGGEFTETGYQDARFRDPGYQVAERLNLPDVVEEDGTGADGAQTGGATGTNGTTGTTGGNGFGGASGTVGASGAAGAGGFAGASGTAGSVEDGNWKEVKSGPSWKKKDFSSRVKGSLNKGKGFLAKGSLGSKILKVILIIAIVCLAVPVLLGLGGVAAAVVTGALAFIASVLAILVGAVLLVGALTLAACVGAVVLLILGLGMLFGHPWSGVLLLGSGLFLLGLSLIGVVLSILVYGKLIPYLLRGVIDGISRLFHRGKKRRKQG